ncbi:DUF4259 domain-containing protein [Streptomyces sp. CA-251247]|uniref:DUF4259 domain-containing protein n=1 Tax=Streptomyces sp. CA-251247 TaxID=3240062 RepID=UPI003D8B60CC
MSVDWLRQDRILKEALTNGADPLHLAHVFSLGAKTSLRCTSAADIGSFSYLPLSGDLGPAEVGTAVMRIAGCNDIDLNMTTGHLGPPTRSDFGGDLDEAAPVEGESMIRGALKRAADPAECFGTSDGERAVAAAVVAQHPDGEPACSNYGLSEPLSELSADLRTLVVDALDQVVPERSELAELWAEAANGPKWRQDVTRLRGVLDPRLRPQVEAVFDI